MIKLPQTVTIYMTSLIVATVSVDNKALKLVLVALNLPPPTPSQKVKEHEH